MVSNVNELLQGSGVTEVSEVKAKAFSQHLGREQEEHGGSERVPKTPRGALCYERTQEERKISCLSDLVWC